MLVGKRGIATGGDGKPAIVLPSADVAAIFDDFLASRTLPTDVLDTGVNLGAGTYFKLLQGDTGLSGTVVAGKAAGVYRIVSTATVGTSSVNGSGGAVIGEQLAWKANSGGGGQIGGLRFAARIAANSWLSGTGMSGLFVGFTDVLTAEVPAHDTGGGLVTSAANCVGFMWGSDGDTGWRGVAAKGQAGDSGDQEVTLTTVGETAANFQVLEIVVQRGPSDTGGVATFYIDGVAKGSLVSPIATSANLVPCLYAYDTGGTTTMDIDWINVSMPRDSGA